MIEKNEEEKMIDLGLDTYPFSPGAFKFLREQISQHIKELVNESVKQSKRHKSDTVSAAHIERASEYLIYSVRRKVFRHIGTFGGIFIGSALSNFLSMWMNGLYPERGVVLSFVFGVIGSVMVTIHMSKD